jgi:ABC-type uncharacterized transport system substrate-binding protein
MLSTWIVTVSDGTNPIVMAGVIDPVATGFVATLSRPGGNITGLSLMAPQLVGKPSCDSSITMVLALG